MIDGLVIKGVASRYKVDTADGIVTSYARGKLKIDGESASATRSASKNRAKIS